MTNILIFNFDGTDNEPADAVQLIDNEGTHEDDNITNILKFHLMAGGNLVSSDSNNEQERTRIGKCTGSASQKAFYYHGVGTYGSRVKRLLNAALANQSSDVAHILNMAMNDFKQHFRPNMKVLVTGFSRGAALGRRFVALIEKHLAENNQRATEPFVYELMFDTVAAMGMPNMSRSSRPKSEVVFENGCTLPEIVIKALHCVSLDDKRKAFQPTLMNHQPQIVEETWFAGAHSDVGGGFYRDGLSNGVLEYALDWLDKTDIEVDYNTKPTTQALSSALPEGVSYVIGIDDVHLTPSALGKNHQQDRHPVLDWFTLDDRVCCVIENDKIDTKIRPQIHSSVKERIVKDIDYMPKSLRNVEHQVIDSSGELLFATGIKHYMT
jgi:hypothetical protein